jgi:hypothetical protein
MTSKTITRNLCFINKMTLIILFSFLLHARCTKTDTILLDELGFSKNLLAGSGTDNNFQKVWKLDSLIVNGSGVLLTSAQLKYYKTFNWDGIYLDFDGNEGKWDMASNTSLEIEITNSSDTKVLSYEIIELNSLNLQLETLGYNDKYQYYFIKQ